MDWRTRLQARIEELGLSRAEVTRRAGVGPTAIRDIIDREQTPSIDNLAKIARAVGYSLSDLYDGTKRIQFALRVNGISEGHGMWSEVPSRHAKVVPLTVFTDETVSIEISGDDLSPNFRRGDIVSGPRSTGTGIGNLIGQECIVQTTSGERMICLLLHGDKPDRYTLRPFDMRQRDRTNTQIEWAAPIRMILRGSY
jgi:transcriptional regulator with XRE-family HTH domain